ncbi:MAG: 1-phosphofructokinase [Lactobacillus sp.]|jgi:1-phosphofructokinase|uniref:Tagatose-6-phosphate kinase n=1 Tax=Lacticaseibacillus suilingensis TaxID=2799577 RepID=A0ABW4BBY9_9LACO|nr:1-phosphofructokinase [Lacticaseibacillus suilingensis]MCI1893917.1 1-phosphofructokinase [Lactobacillus sp.]MCI1917835.1 1-phosphofructokinase [Lactobacillus sp.]MCI1941923.1 1-phosphofructokinase [Lactobacillus sp.]MCI1972853.1 1-phosphofructokinase [Lactobacillus sp.]MCI2017753.1 1-phosphofructokinase [Lactobacillus sp.]
MIYTLTLNPAIDLFIDTPRLDEGVVNRTNRYDVQANGKGVNVSFILERLGVANTALGLGGGFTLAYIQSQLTASGIENQFIDTGGITRINVFTHVDDGEREYKLVNPGPVVPASGLKQLEKLLEQLTNQDALIVSGSFAQGIEPALISQLGVRSQQQGFKLIIDTSYSAVMDCLKYRPFLIKPNNAELASWYGRPANIDSMEIVKLGRDMQHRGAQNILISCGNAGAIFIGDQVLKGNAPQIDVLNTAGAGDTMLGTFVAGLVKGKPSAENLKYAIAAGSDTARNSWVTDFNHLDDLLAQITVSTFTEGGK